MPLELHEWTDQPSWDAFVGSQKTCHYNQGWGWGEAAEPLGGRIFRVAALDGSTIKAAMSVGSNPMRLTSRTQLYVSRGPTVDHPTNEIFDLFAKWLELLGREENSVGAKMEPNAPAGDRAWTDLLLTNGFRPLHPPSQPRSTWLLHLEPDLDTLLANMKSKWRYNIRLAEKKGVEIVSGTEKDLDDFYSIYRETSDRDGFYIHPQHIYEFIFRTYWELGQLEMLLARYQGSVIAAVTLVHLGNTAWYLYGASTDRNREVMAPHLLQWEGIKWAKDRGAAIYDFRGVPDVPAEGQEMYGVYRFKQGFGGRHATLLESYAKGYRQPLFSLWRSYWQGRYLAQSAKRRIQHLPQRQWA